MIAYVPCSKFITNYINHVIGKSLGAFGQIVRFGAVINDLILFQIMKFQKYVKLKRKNDALLKVQ